MATVGRTKACEACRQLKLRCDAHQYDYEWCSRCRRTRRDCVFAAKSRPRIRKTKADLEQELDTLRRQLVTSPTTVTLADSADVSIQGMSATEENNSSLPHMPTSGMDDQPTATGTIQETPSAETSQQSISEASRSTPSGIPMQDNLDSPVHSVLRSTSFTVSTGSTVYQPQALGSYTSETLSRTLDDKQLDARKIDGCVASFFQWYAPSLPGMFDSLEKPNDLYEYSEFLFWAVVHVGSRKYAGDPTIVECFIKPLDSLAQRSLFDPDRAIPSIQAALLLCLWPLPINTTFRVRTHAMAGAAMQLAIQKGMPFASRKQDFSPIPLRRSQAEDMFRARLWGYCVMVFQSNSLVDGYPCAMTVEPNSFDRGFSPFNGLAGVVGYRYRLHIVLTDSLALILGSTDLVSDKSNDSLNSLVCQFDLEAQRVFCAEDDDLHRFSLSSIRLLVRAFHFFSFPNMQRASGIIQTYYIACDLIETATRLDRDQDFGNYCDIMHTRVINLAAVVILRVLRSALAEQVNAETGEAMYFEAIRVSKKHSILNDDLDARNAIILTQLWSSTRTFRYNDGSVDGLRLLLRARLSMSVYFDAHWWWRAEFGGRSNPYLEFQSNTAQKPGPAGTSDMSTKPPDNLDGRVDLEATNTDSTILPDISSDVTLPILLPDWNWNDLGELGFDWF